MPVLRVYEGQLSVFSEQLLSHIGSDAFNHDVILRLKLFAKQTHEVGNIGRIVLLSVPPLNGGKAKLDVRSFGGEELGEGS